MSTWQECRPGSALRSDLELAEAGAGQVIPELRRIPDEQDQRLVRPDELAGHGMHVAEGVTASSFDR